jgi:hypothetical protein
VGSGFVVGHRARPPAVQEDDWSVVRDWVVPVVLLIAGGIGRVVEVFTLHPADVNIALAIGVAVVTLLRSGGEVRTNYAQRRTQMHTFLDLGGSRRGVGDGFLEGTEVDGFGEVRGEPGLTGAAKVVFLTEAGDRDRT